MIRQPLLLAIGLLLVLASGVAWGTEYVPPTRQPLDAYVAQAGRNPFGPPSEKEIEVSQPDFAKHLYINGIMNYDGEITVYVANKNDKSVFSLTKNREHEGIKLQDYEISPTVGASTVIVTSGSQSAKLTFDQAQMFTAKAPTGAANNRVVNNTAQQAKTNQQQRATGGNTQQERSSTKRTRRPIRVIRAPKNKTPQVP